jgi:hypothetical protein
MAQMAPCTIRGLPLTTEGSNNARVREEPLVLSAQTAALHHSANDFWCDRADNADETHEHKFETCETYGTQQ